MMLLFAVFQVAVYQLWSDVCSLRLFYLIDESVCNVMPYLCIDSLILLSHLLLLPSLIKIKKGRRPLDIT